MAYFEGEIPVVTSGNNNNGFGNGWEGLIGLALVASLFGGGWGFGGGFGGRGGNADFTGYQLGRLATTNDVASGFSTSEIMSDLNSIILGQAQMQNFINQGFAGLSQVVNSGFAGVDNAICTLGYQNQAGFNAIGTQVASLGCDIRQAISDCCCKTNLAIQDLKYSNERQTCDLINVSNANTRAILDYLTNEKIEGLRAENTALKGQISNDRQSRFIIDELRSGNCPVPAYVVQPSQPVTFPTNCCGNVSYANFGYNNGCGCGASVQ